MCLLHGTDWMYIYIYIYIYTCTIEVKFVLQCVDMWTSKMIAKKTVNKVNKIYTVVVRYSR